MLPNVCCLNRNCPNKLGLLVTILQFSKGDPQSECNIPEIRFFSFFPVLYRKISRQSFEVDNAYNLMLFSFEKLMYLGYACLLLKRE